MCATGFRYFAVNARPSHEVTDTFLSSIIEPFADQRERATGLETVVIDVLTKPFSLAEMRSKVGQALALKG